MHPPRAPCNRHATGSGFSGRANAKVPRPDPAEMAGTCKIGMCAKRGAEKHGPPERKCVCVGAASTGLSPSAGPKFGQPELGSEKTPWARHSGDHFRGSESGGGGGGSGPDEIRKIRTRIRARRSAPRTNSEPRKRNIAQSGGLRASARTMARLVEFPPHKELPQTSTHSSQIKASVWVAAMFGQSHTRPRRRRDPLEPPGLPNAAAAPCWKTERGAPQVVRRLRIM